MAVSLFLKVAPFIICIIGTVHSSGVHWNRLPSGRKKSAQTCRSFLFIALFSTLKIFSTMRSFLVSTTVP